MNITFRNAEPEDLHEIMEIEHQSFSKAICESADVFRERIDVFPEGFKLLLENNTIIGYICGEIWSYREKIQPEYFTLGHSISRLHNGSGTELYISSMGILPDYRSKGYGMKMFNAYIDELIKLNRKITSVILIVSEKWEKALQIYKKNEFKEIGELNNFFSDDRGIIMRKVISR